jgi:hypothetical protein
MAFDAHKLFANQTMAGVDLEPPMMAGATPQTLPPDAPRISSDIPKKPGWDWSHGVQGANFSQMQDQDVDMFRGLASGIERGIMGIPQAAVDLEDFTVGNLSRMADSATAAGFQALGVQPKGLSMKDGKLAWVPTQPTDYKSMKQVVDDSGVLKPVLERPHTDGGKLVEGIASFVVPFKAAKVALGTAGAYANWGKLTGLATDITASAASAFASLDPMEGNLANVAKDMGLDHTAIAELTGVGTLVDALSVDHDDSAIEARLKNTVADFATNIAVTGAMEMMVKGVKTLRAGRVVQKAAEVTDTADTINVDAAHSTPDVAAHVEARVAETAGTQGELFPDLAPAKAPAEDVIDTVEKMVLNINAKGAKVTEEEINALAQNWIKGGSYEGIERMGVNPDRLDFGKWMAEHADPAALSQGIHSLLEGISGSEVGQRIASVMGSASRTDEAAAFLSKMVGSDVNTILTTFKGKTKNLDVYVRAASSLVGGETKKLMVLAENLRDLAMKGEFSFDNAAHPAYIEFLKQFETLTTMQSAMRGSFSEMGRGLRSIQQVNAVRTAKADLELAKSVIKDAPDAAVQTAKIDQMKGTWDEKLRALADAKTPAQRKALLDQVLAANGNLAGVAKNVASGEGTLFAKACRWMRETSANLFSFGTASATAMGMVAYHGTDLIAGLVHEPLAYLTKNDEFLVAAAANRAKWGTLLPAYVNGLTRGFQVVGSELLKESGRIAEGLGSQGVNAATRAEAAAKAWETHFGGKPAMAGDKFGKQVIGSVANKFDRPDFHRDPAIYLKAADVDNLLQSDNHGPAVMSAAAKAIIGLATNSFGAVTRAGRIVSIEFLDEVTGSAVYGAHKYAEAIATTTREGIKQGLSGRALADYAEKAAKDIVSSSSRETTARLQNLIEAGSADTGRIEQLAKDVIQRYGIEEVAQSDARRILFQDELQTSLGQGLKKAGSVDKAGIIAPFVHTPLRILETGLMDFSPIGVFKRSLREDLRSNGPKAAEALAKIGMGTTAMMLGYSMAANGQVVGYDGGSSSSAREARPQYSMKVGDKWVEYGRIDPFATVIGIGADIYQFEKMLEDTDLSGDQGAMSQLQKLAETGFMTLVSNIMSKTYLQGMKQLSEGLLPSNLSQGMQNPGLTQLISGLEQRFVPVGGFQKGMSGEIANTQVQTSDPADFWQQLKNQYVSSWFFSRDTLYDKRDPFLGTKLTYDRDAGIKVADHDSDPLRKELSNLSFALPKNPTSIQGVKLTGDQQHSLLAALGDTKVGGQTLEERLRDYVVSPEWKQYSDYQKVEILKMIRQEYYDNAKDTVLGKDRGLQADVAGVAFQKQLLMAGEQPHAIPAKVQAFKKELLQQP